MGGGGFDTWHVDYVCMCVCACVCMCVCVCVCVCVCGVCVCVCLSLFFAHIMSHINYVSNAWDECACVHMKQLHSLHKRAIKFLMPIPNMDYKQKCCALKLLHLDKQRLLNKCVLMQKVVHGKPTVPERFHDSF